MELNKNKQYIITEINALNVGIDFDYFHPVSTSRLKTRTNYE